MNKSQKQQIESFATDLSLTHNFQSKSQAVKVAELLYKMGYRQGEELLESFITSLKEKYGNPPMHGFDGFLDVAYAEVDKLKEGILQNV